MINFVSDILKAMEGIFRFDTVNEYNLLNNHETLHPLVSVIDFQKQSQNMGEREKMCGLIMVCTAYSLRM